MLLVKFTYENQPNAEIYDQLTKKYTEIVSDGFSLDIGESVYVLLDCYNMVKCFQKGDITLRNNYTETMLEKISKWEEEI